MKAILAEKPSVAREIAQIVGATKKNEGYYEGNGFTVTWALGHLVGLALPEAYDASAYERSHLPILPETFQLVARKSGRDKRTKSDKDSLMQLDVIATLFDRCESIIVATDAGREGELIFRYIYSYLNCYKPFERLWISSLTEKAIRNGLDNLLPGSHFDNLYKAAKSRSEADWCVGINATQAMSIAGGSLYTLGRVQTPTLAMICARHMEHDTFIPRHTWQLQLAHRKEFMDFTSVSVSSWPSLKEAEQSLKSVERAGMALVTEVNVSPVADPPPLLYNLTGLQKEANLKFGLTADNTLSLAQSLYEKKFITYPRTGSQNIPEDVWETVPDLVRSLATANRYQSATSKLKWGRLNKRIVNDLKVTDHHGILVTGKIPSALNRAEQTVYDLIAHRLLESLSEPCLRQRTDVQMEVGHLKFVVRATAVLDIGWRGISGDFEDPSFSVLKDLPLLDKGNELKINGVRLLERSTTAPERFSEASLLSAMEHAGRQLHDKTHALVLKDIGIGTPATRAGTIEKLIQMAYVQRDKKRLVPTEKGLQLYQWVKDMLISDVVLTAEWEQSLKDIEAGTMTAGHFRDTLRTYVEKVTRELLSLETRESQHEPFACPKCGQVALRVLPRQVKCGSLECGWTLFRTVCGIHLGLEELKLLFLTGRTSLLKGLKSKSGKSFDARLKLTEDCSTAFEFK